MSSDLFKTQASRLAQHLAARHGVQLKHASVLEAIAALHGARDWNTLLAGDKSLLGKVRAAFQRPAAQVGAKKSSPLSLGVSCAGPAHLAIGDEQLLRHILIAGTDSTTAVAGLLAQQLARGGGFLLFDRAGPEAVDKLLHQATLRPGRTDRVLEVRVSDVTAVHQACRDLQSLVACNSAIRVVLDPHGSNSAEAEAVGALIQSAQSAGRALQDDGMSSDVPFMLVVTHAAAASAPVQVATALRQCRTMNIAVVLQVDALDAMPGFDVAARAEVLANCNTKVLFKHRDRESELRVSDWLQGEVPSRAVQACAEMRTLQTHQALVVQAGVQGWTRIRAHDALAFA